MSEDKEKVNTKGFIKKFGFESIPKGGVLLCRNTITGEHKVKASGLRFIHLWEEYKYVSTKNLTVDYPSVTLKVKDGFEVIIDPAIDTIVTDPIKFEEECVDPDTTSSILLNQLLKTYISTKTYEDLVGLTLTENSQDYIDFFKNEFDDFEEKYGLHMGRIYFKTVDLTPVMKDDYEKKAVQQKESERRIIEAQTRKKIVEIDKEIAKDEAVVNRLKLTPFEKSMNDIVKMLQKQGLNSDQIKEVLRDYVVTRGENDTKIISVGNNDSALSAAILNSLNGKSK